MEYTIVLEESGNPETLTKHVLQIESELFPREENYVEVIVIEHQIYHEDNALYPEIWYTFDEDTLADEALFTELGVTKKNLLLECVKTIKESI